MKHLLIFIACCYAYPIQAQHFRNATWGESMDKVKMGESEEPIDVEEILSEYREAGFIEDPETSLMEDKMLEVFGDGVLLFPDIVAGLSSYVVFMFNDKDQLYRAGYLFLQDHITENLYLREYEEINEILTDKYGEDFDILDEWFDDHWKSYPDEYGYAVKTGDVTFERKWELHETSIHHILSGGNYQVEHLLLYKSKKFSGEDVKSKF